jgi:hypothetical protein
MLAQEARLGTEGQVGPGYPFTKKGGQGSTLRTHLRVSQAKNRYAIFL